MIKVRKTVKFDQLLTLCRTRFGTKLSAYAISRGSLIAMFKIKEAAMSSVARRGSNDQWPIYRSLPWRWKADVAHSLNIGFRPWVVSAGSFSAWLVLGWVVSAYSDRIWLFSKLAKVPTALIFPRNRTRKSVHQYKITKQNWALFWNNYCVHK